MYIHELPTWPRFGWNAGALMEPLSRIRDGSVGAVEDVNPPLLTREVLFAWHASLGLDGRGSSGGWRDDRKGPMRVVSRESGRRCVHFVAPDAKRLEREMQVFLNWFNRDRNMDPLIKSGVALLWFLTIHPFEDGNGRIGRAIAEMAIEGSRPSGMRRHLFFAQCQRERAGYYRAIEQAQRGTMDVTPWLEWFLGCLGRAVEGSRGEG